MPFDQKTLNGFEMIRRGAAREIPAGQPGHRAFVGVHPPWPEKGFTQWGVRRFEILVSLVDEYPCEEDLVNSQFCRLNTLEEVESLLAEWGIDPAGFDAP